MKSKFLRAYNAELYKRLSPQEKLVAIHVWMGMADKNISHLLGISESTVRFHFGNICRKFSSTNRVHVAIIVERSYGECTLSEATAITTLCARLIWCNRKSKF